MMVLQSCQDGTAFKKKRKLNGGKSKACSVPNTQGVSAKSQLHELCAVKRWKPPVYETCDSEAPCHNKLFTVKVRIQFEEDSKVTVLECFGDPKHKKKAAAEHTAEVALWYLKHVGHTLETNKASGHLGEIKPSQ